MPKRKLPALALAAAVLLPLFAAGCPQSPDSRGLFPAEQAARLYDHYPYQGLIAHDEPAPTPLPQPPVFNFQLSPPRQQKPNTPSFYDCAAAEIGWIPRIFSCIGKRV